MYLAVHAAVGAAAAATTNDPLVAFGIGWLSHYLVDAVPHGDERAGEWTKRGHEVKRYMLLAGIDGLILSAILAVQMSRHGIDPALLAAIGGSVLPDVMWGMEKVFKRKMFGPLHRLHSSAHNYLRIRLPSWLGLLVQAAIAGGFWFMLIR